MAASNAKHQTITINKISLTDDDFRRLTNGDWLNCKLLETYFFLVAQESAKNGVRVKILSSLFWSKYERQGYEAVKTWIKKDNILTYDIIFTLINTAGSHWTLMYMNLRRQQLWHLDPLTGVPMEKTIADFKRLFDRICTDQRKGLPILWKEWDLTPQKLPLQNNTMDCGVFVCQYALHLMNIRTKDNKLTRDQMNFELTHQSIQRQSTKDPSKKRQTKIFSFYVATHDGKITLAAPITTATATIDTATITTTATNTAVCDADTTIDTTNVATTTTTNTAAAAAAATTTTPPPTTTTTITTTTTTAAATTTTSNTATTATITATTIATTTTSDMLLRPKHRGVTSNNAVTEDNSMQSGMDESNEGFQDTDDKPNPLATTKEKYLWGLLKGKEYARSNVIVNEVHGRGRSAFAAKDFKSGDFICDYGGVVRKKVGEDWGDERNASLGLGYYCLDAVYNNETYVFDATASINDPGRYINHARRNCNLQLMPPVKIGVPPNSNLRIGFVAKKCIHAGEELFYDYGIKDPDLPWLATDAKKIATTLTLPLPQMQSATSTRSKPRPPPKRVPRKCPIPGCRTTSALIKLADHIRVIHPQYNQTQRQFWLQKARKAPAIKQRIDVILKNSQLKEPPKRMDTVLILHDTLVKPESLQSSNVSSVAALSHGSKDHLPQQQQVHESLDFEEFKTYLRVTHQKNKDTTAAILRDVKMYLDESGNSNVSDRDKLLDIRKIEKFTEEMKDEKKYKPTTRAEKLRRIKLAIKCMIRKGDDDKLYWRGKRVMDDIDELCHGLGKEIGYQRQQHGLMMREKLHQSMDPNEFLEHPKIKEKLSNAFDNLHKGQFTKQYVDTAIAYAAAVTLYENGQRSGVITNLTIGEFQLWQEDENDMVVIPCVHHKTGAQGMAQLAITTETETMLLSYYETIRMKIKPKESILNDRFFLTFNGGVYTQVYRKLREGLSVGNLNPPPPSEYRVVISSESRRCLPDIERRNVVKHLSHSMQTSVLYYDLMNSKDAVAAHSTIQKLSLTRRWSQTEINALTDRWPLNGSLPLLKDCKDYIQEKGMARTGSDLIYKWRQLKGQL